MNRVSKRAGILMLFALLLLSGFVFFTVEYVAKADDWVIFPGSPHVYSGDNIDCGSVIDREGVFLLRMRNGERNYCSNTALKQSVIHWVGDRYGYISAPALSNYTSQIAGYDLLNGTYSYADQSGIASLTLSAKAQMAALEAMGSYKGTVAVYNYKTGELLCAVTTPSFDPDDVPDIDSDTTGEYEGIYLNRFTQASYTPGSIFKIVTAAAALETITDIREQSFVCSGAYEIQGEFITCEGVHGSQSIKDAFCNSCNCAFAQIALQLGPKVMERYVAQFEITAGVSFDGITTANGNFQAPEQSLLNLGWSAVGQYKDQINPCAFLTFLGAVAGGGKGVLPYIVESVTVGKDVTYQAQTSPSERIMSASTANTLMEFMRNNVQSKYGDDNFPGLTVCAKTGTAEVGDGKKPNAMFCGFVSDEEYPLAFIVCVENGGYGRDICVPIASRILQECKGVLDQERK